MAYEKISEKHLREEKVKKLKEKILVEIKEYSDDARRYIKNFPADGNEKRWKSLVSREFTLLKLKEFIQKKDCFLRARKIYPEDDIIIYTIPDKNLNIWLQEDYKFVSNFLFNAVDCSVFDLLNDDYFAYEHTSIIEHAMYDEKQKEKENN